MFSLSKSIFSLQRPSHQEIDRFLAEQHDAQFSYPEVGATAPIPGTVESPLEQTHHLKKHYRLIHHRFRIGSGRSDYERAKKACTAWEYFNMSWVQLCWPDRLAEPGVTFAIMGYALGIWSINGSRVIYRCDKDTGPIHCHGFGYGTLPGHAIRGEERLTVEWHGKDDSVWYDILSFSKESKWLSKVGSFKMKDMQQRFALDSRDAMIRATRG